MGDRERTMEEIAEGFETGGTDDYFSEDFRLAILWELHHDGHISRAEVGDVLKFSEPTDPPEYIIGLVAGRTNAATKSIERSLSDTDYAISANEIEAEEATVENMMRAVIETGQNLRGLINTTYQGVSQIFAPAVGALGEGVWGEEGYYGQEQQDDRGDRTRVQARTREEIARLHEAGYINDNLRKELEVLTGSYGAADYDQLIQKLQAVYEEFEPSDWDSARTRNDVLAGLERRRGPLAVADDTLEEEALPETVTVIDPITGEVREVPIDPETGLPDFGDAAIETPPITRPRASYLGRNEVYDPSTGDKFSTLDTVDQYGNRVASEWERLKTDAVTQGNYLLTKQMPDTLADLVGRDEFAGQYSQAPDGSYYKTDIKPGSTPQIPIEDLGIRSPVPNAPWETGTIDYKSGDGSAAWMSMSARERAYWMDLTHQYGLMTDEQYSEMGGGFRSGTYGVGQEQWIDGRQGAGDPLNLFMMGMWDDVYGLMSDVQKDETTVLKALGLAKANDEATWRTQRGSGARGPTYSVPASLREVPDYKTLAQRTKSVFQNELGRDMEDWELKLLSDELNAQYVETQTERRQIHKAAWDDAVAGGSLDVDFTSVDEPLEALQYDIQETYAAELDRYDRVEDRANNRRLLMDSLAVGERMI